MTNSPDKLDGLGGRKNTGAWPLGAGGLDEVIKEALDLEAVSEASRLSLADETVARAKAAGYGLVDPSDSGDFSSFQVPTRN
ncbi:MAG: hypothetical protein ABI220_00345 [Candidatus Saccharimonadales bacterium]